ncbi:hypothetical protein CRM90_28555 [Mycobacterium sp. ENV421]|uniref:hypothetical protein n=1 Tax=Mycobacterium sp. ENV421 TaxID=1213407 RepID=UPI000C9BA4F0|nr:hypothetical protein [Mycobacterium sp. ENV421]PND54333.1 hypothetical protein CRM90_28555 [Mycobacterium sp. ENV421]
MINDEQQRADVAMYMVHARDVINEVLSAPIETWSLEEVREIMSATDRFTEFYAVMHRQQERDHLKRRAGLKLLGL